MTYFQIKALNHLHIYEIDVSYLLCNPIYLFINNYTQSRSINGKVKLGSSLKARHCLHDAIGCLYAPPIYSPQHKH